MKNEIHAVTGGFGYSGKRISRRTAGVVCALLCSAIFMMINRAVCVLIRECLFSYELRTAANFS